MAQGQAAACSLLELNDFNTCYYITAFLELLNEFAGDFTVDGGVQMSSTWLQIVCLPSYFHAEI